MQPNALASAAFIVMLHTAYSCIFLHTFHAGQNISVLSTRKSGEKIKIRKKEEELPRKYFNSNVRKEGKKNTKENQEKPKKEAFLGKKHRKNIKL